MCEAAYENYTENPEEFVKFLEDADKPLYNGCKRYTKLSALVKLYNTKARHEMSDALFSDLLTDFGDMLPDNHNLSSSTYDAKKILSCLSLSHEKIYACSNDCILYRKQYKDCVSCPKCGLSGWKLTKKNIEKKGVPAKVMWYFPPIPRFKRMYKSLETSKNLTWHKETTRVAGQLRHPSDSPSWRLVDHMWPDFESEPRNLRLALETDGINPHRNLSSRYSCWPVMLATYNLPPNMCMKRKFIMLTMLISGPKQPGNDIDVYLDVLVEDFQRLWEGVDGVYDAYRKQFFTLKAVLLWTINDFPAYGKTKDNVATRLDMLQMGVRPELRPKCGEKKTYLPPSACSFTKKREVTSVPVVNGYKSSRSEHKTFLKSIFPKKEKDERWIQDAHNKRFIDWFRAKVAAEIDSRNGGTTSTLTWLAHGPRSQCIKYSSYVVNSYLYQTKARDDERVCQNSGVSLVANTMLVSSAKDKNPLMVDVSFYGVIEEIWELDYHQFQVLLFKCAWVTNDKGVINNDECGFTLVNLNKRGHRNDEFVLASQVNQVFYIDNPARKGWSIVLPVPNRCHEGEDDCSTNSPESRPIDNVVTHEIPWTAHIMSKRRQKNKAAVE
ncbi:uncharacterized protein [Henckelia pumila]|uniref:uncharacterized protein n=1 Tax=Henckelia pumila TaxID=405737 RepID=UPI003C6E9472